MRLRRHYWHRARDCSIRLATYSRSSLRHRLICAAMFSGDGAPIVVAAKGKVEHRKPSLHPYRKGVRALSFSRVEFDLAKCGSRRSTRRVCPRFRAPREKAFLSSPDSGIKLEPVENASLNSRNPNSLVLQMIKSSLKRDRCKPIIARQKRNSQTKSRSPTASTLFWLIPEKPSC